MGVSAFFLPSAEGAAMAGTIDAVLAVVIAVAYILTRGWLAWKN
jgi:hypothetical protein